MDDEKFWSDSKVILGYIDSDVCWLKVLFVN